ESLAVALDDPRRLGQVSVFLADHFYLRGAYDQAIAVAQRPLTLATAGREVVLHALANHKLGQSQAYHAQGDYRRAIDCLQTVAALGTAYTLAGRVADAVPLLTQAMDQMTATEMIVMQALCSLSLGEAQVLAGHLEEAHALAEGALTLARTHKERGHEAYALRLLGDIATGR